MQKNNEELSTRGSLTEVEEVAPLLSYKVLANGSRKIEQSCKNWEIVLENDWRVAGVVKFDDFSKQIYLCGETPWEYSDNFRAWDTHDDSELFSMVQSDYKLTSRQDYFDAVKNVAMRNKFHPVKDLLESIEWNGEDNIHRLLPDYLGAEDNDYNYEVMKLALLGGISRIYQPGVKYDYAVILKGEQGLGKSTFLQLLALDDNYFNDSLDSLDTSNAVQSLLGSWIVELAELKSLERTAGGIDSIKRFISARQDKIRLPYERRCDLFLRQCIFFGTTNKENFLTDETGNRRFLVVEVGANPPTKSLFDENAIEDFKQAWAQALHIYKTEQVKLILPQVVLGTAAELQEAARVDDGKIGLIEDYLQLKSRVCAVQIWYEALGEVRRPQKWEITELNNIIAGMPEWERLKSSARFGKYGTQRGFQRK